MQKRLLRKDQPRSHFPVDPLRRYPLDDPPQTGGRIDGYAFPIDERHETYWDWDPWRLTSVANATRLRPGFHYLLAYYMGLSYGFIEEAVDAP